MINFISQTLVPFEKEYIWAGKQIDLLKTKNYDKFIQINDNQQIIVKILDGNKIFNCGKVTDLENFYEINITESQLVCRANQISDWRKYPIDTNIENLIQEFKPDQILQKWQIYILKIMALNIILLIFFNIIIYHSHILKSKFLKKSDINSNTNFVFIFTTILLVLTFIFATNFSFKENYKIAYQVEEVGEILQTDLQTLEMCQNPKFKFETRIYPHVLSQGTIFLNEKSTFVTNTPQQLLDIQIPLITNSTYINVPLSYSYDSNFVLKVEAQGSRKLSIFKDKELIYSEIYSKEHIDILSIVNIRKSSNLHSSTTGIVTVVCQNFPENISSLGNLVKFLITFMLLTYIFSQGILHSRINAKD